MSAVSAFGTPAQLVNQRRWFGPKRCWPGYAPGDDAYSVIVPAMPTAERLVRGRALHAQAVTLGRSVREVRDVLVTYFRGACIRTWRGAAHLLLSKRQKQPPEEAHYAPSVMMGQ